MQIQERAYTSPSLALATEVADQDNSNYECPIWVISGHRPTNQGCPLCPRKRTCLASNLMSLLKGKGVGM